MLMLQEHPTLEEASLQLLNYVLEPAHWKALDATEEESLLPALQPLDYHARVGKLRICACINVRDDLEVVLHVAFRAPGLTPAHAADHLERFLSERLPLQPNTEWTVEIDARHWIHFERSYTSQRLEA
jgi:hypothetical protein